MVERKYYYFDFRYFTYLQEHSSVHIQLAFLHPQPFLLLHPHFISSAHAFLAIGIVVQRESMIEFCRPNSNPNPLEKTFPDLTIHWCTKYQLDMLHASNAAKGHLVSPLTCCHGRITPSLPYQHCLIHWFCHREPLCNVPEDGSIVSQCGLVPCE